MDLEKYQKSLLETNQSITSTERIDSNWQFIWRQSQKIAEIWSEENIICNNSKSVYLLTRLIFSLSVSTYFSGTVSIITLESASFPQASENAHFTKDSNGNKSDKRTYLLKFVYSLKGMQKQQARAFFKRDIQRKKSDCQFIFHKITEILRSYRIQNRLSYWISRLNDDLKKHFQSRDSRMIEQQFANYSNIIFPQ